MSKENTKAQSKIFDLKLFRKLMVFLKPYKGIFYFVMIASILLSVFSTLTPYLLKIVVDTYIVPRNYNGLVLFVTIMFSTLLLEVIFQFLFIFYANLLGQNVVKDIRVKLFEKMMKFKMSYFDNYAVGRIVTRVVNDMETIASIFSQGLFMIIADVLKMLFILGIMFYTDWQLSIVVISILPILIYATRVFQKNMKKAFSEVRKEVANINTFIQERISGMKIVQLFTREDTEYKNFIKINNKHRKAWLKTVWYNSIFFPIAEISSSIAIGLLVWYGGGQIIQESGITLGVIFLFIQLSQMLFRPLWHIADKFNVLQMGMVASDRIFEILETDSVIKDEGTLVKEKVNGVIEFKNVQFSYVSEEKVLKDVSFKINKGETIAIVGATGSGKTTIINLLCRFYEFQKGDILIDGTSIRDYRLSNLRERIAIVLQDVFLFSDTILNNIRLFDDSISLEKIIEAAKKIEVHEFIESLPEKYNYDVRERGVMLSAGQKQLIAFLRAYISNPDILVLDEATSSIDTYSEELIQKAIQNITQNKTSIVIAHRLTTIKNADKIIVMKDGQILEMGSHEELLKLPEGNYSKLYESQFLKNEQLV